MTQEMGGESETWAKGDVLVRRWTPESRHSCLPLGESLSLYKPQFPNLETGIIAPASQVCGEEGEIIPISLEHPGPGTQEGLSKGEFCHTAARRGAHHRSRGGTAGGEEVDLLTGDSDSLKGGTKILREKTS